MTSKKYILYIEDDKLEIMRFKIALKQNKFEGELEVGMNGEEGLNILNEKRHYLPSFIVLDLRMPVMDGFEFLDNIKKDITFRRIPIIILSTSQNESDILKSYDYQVAGYFTKPFSPMEYNKIVELIKLYWETAKTV